MTKCLYIHIPFCKKFCAYCDFVKCIYQKENADKYIDLLIDNLEKKYPKNKFETIYLGGGTPNCLNDIQLEKLLKILSKYLTKKYEFTIECNPEFVTVSQIKILKKYKINRVSLGVQTLDTNLLKTMNRLNHKNMVQNAINIFRKNNICNISCDLIYGFNKQTTSSLKCDIDFLIKNKVKHLSLYSLEIKDNTLWGKQKYKVNDEEVDDLLAYAIKYLKSKNFVRYEVSNWSLNNKYQSRHNVAIWNTNDWAALGLGAYGMENKILYHYEGTILNWKLIKEKLNNFDLLYQVMMMGLRLKTGINLNNALHMKAFKYFKSLLLNNKLVTINKNKVYCNNINLLDNLLVELLNYEKK